MSNKFVLAVASAVTATALLSAPAHATVLWEDFDANDGGFTVTNAGGVQGPWTYNGGSGTWSTDGSTDLGSPSSSILTSPTVVIPASGNLSLTFRHRFSFEYQLSIRWDGGQVQINVNGGGFNAVPDGSFSANGYAPEAIGGNNVLNGQKAFNGVSPTFSPVVDFGAQGAYEISVANLGPFTAGDTIAIRFVGAWDEFARGALPNWEIDQVHIAAVPEPGTLALFGLGLAGLGFARRRKVS